MSFLLNFILFYHSLKFLEYSKKVKEIIKKKKKKKINYSILFYRYNYFIDIIIL